MKKILIVLIALVLGVVLSGCNTQLIDTTFKFDSAVIAMPDGSVVKGKVQSWKDYDDNDSIQVVIDGVTYFTHISNVVLVDG